MGGPQAHSTPNREEPEAHNFILSETLLPTFKKKINTTQYKTQLSKISRDWEEFYYLFKTIL